MLFEQKQNMRLVAAACVNPNAMMQNGEHK
jgi:hypothetical protein